MIEAQTAREPRYAWVMLAIVFVMTGLGFGSVATVAVFIKPIAAEFGWARADLSLAYSVSVIGAGLGGILMGYLSDRLPVRAVVFVGAVVSGGAFFLLARLGARLDLYIAYGLLGFLGVGAIMTPLLNSVMNWFSANRGLAVGIAGAGGSVGSALVPFLAADLIVARGWRGAYLGLGVLFLAVLIPLSLLARNPPAAAAAKGAQGTGGGSYNGVPRVALIALLALAVVFCCVCMSTPMVHVVPLASDLGFGPRVAAGLITTMMLVGIVGRVSVGRLADRFGVLRIYIVVSLAQTVTSPWFPLIPSLTGLYAMAILFGIGNSGVMTALTLCAREWAPPAHTGTSLGVVTFMGWVGMAIGSWQAGWSYDLTGGYGPGFTVAALAGGVNLALLALLYRLTVSRAPAALPQAA
jgi:MFS family permease